MVYVPGVRVTVLAALAVPEGAQWLGLVLLAQSIPFDEPRQMPP
jgi:hypothetical protein